MLRGAIVKVREDSMKNFPDEKVGECKEIYRRQMREGRKDE